MTIDDRKAYDAARGRLPHRVEARKRYVASDHGASVMRRLRKASSDRYPEKRIARIAFSNAIRDGKIVKGPCSICGTTLKVEGHHEDYSKPFDVTWLCTTHHKEAHAKIKTERNQKCGQD